MIVIDASAVLELVLATRLADEVDRRVFQSGETLHAPHLIDIEAAHALRRYARTGGATPQRCLSALDNLANLQIERYSHTILLQRIWELRHNLSAYDAAYVALAEALDAPLLTSDGRIARASGHRAQVSVIEQR